MTNDKTVLLECEIFPCIAWFQQFLTHSYVNIEQYEFFERTSFRNRYNLAGPNGLVSLSIPILGGRNQKTIMKDIKISYDENWQSLHWKTIVSCYKRSPFFEYYEYLVQPLFEKKHDFLIDYNILCFATVNKILQIHKPFKLTEQYQTNDSDIVLDYRKVMKADNFNNYTKLPTYIQVFHERNGFKNNLSILDMMFCEGKSLVEKLERTT